jgi:ATP-binding protein involved in chromosome partitioning
MPGPSSLPSPDAVRGALLGVIDPELGDNVVDLGMVKGVDIGDDGTVEVTMALTIAGCPLRTQLTQDVETRVGSVPGVANVVVTMGEMTAEERSAVMARARRKAQEKAPETEIPPTARIVAIASGKGGVGKSSVTANLAAALAQRGLTVGVLDADIWGFSIPRMLGTMGRLGGEAGDNKIRPLEKRVGEGLLKIVSMGSIQGANEDEALMFRGQILTGALRQFLEEVRWGEMDYLLIDMPPGTGDIQMALARMLPRAEMIIVTTPALAAQKVATRAADMARRGYLRVAGVIENMSAFVCDHGESYALFGEGGGKRLAEKVGVPLLGQVPLDPDVARGGDEGRPVVLAGDGPVALAFREIADRIATEAIPVVEMAGCTARLLEQVEAALGPKS